MRNKPVGASVYGVDIGKTRFDVAGLDESGVIVQRLKFRREALLAFFASAPAATVGMEACPGSQWLARRLQALGHKVRIIPAQFVKPYVKSNKNDARDAEAIAEATTRPTMRFVEVKTPDQVDAQALHRVRERMVKSRTAMINQMRGLCLEYGVALREGAGVFKIDLPKALGDEANELTQRMRRLLAELFEDFLALDRRVVDLTREIEAMAQSDDRARRLQTIPGLGPMGATALLAAVGDARQFRRARDLAVWLGLVPRQHSTGGKTVLLGISKRGNGYLRRLIIHGARSCVLHLDRSRDRLGKWLDQLQARMHVNKVTVALASKIARIAWVILTRPGALYQRTDPAFA